MRNVAISLVFAIVCDFSKFYTIFAELCELCEVCKLCDAFPPQSAKAPGARARAAHAQAEANRDLFAKLIYPISRNGAKFAKLCEMLRTCAKCCNFASVCDFFKIYKKIAELCELCKVCELCYFRRERKSPRRESPRRARACRNKSRLFAKLIYL